MIKHLVASSLLAFSFQANATFATIENLEEGFKSEAMSAAGYVMGVVDLADGKLFCVPNNVTLGTMISLFEKVMSQLTEEQKKASAASLIRYSLHFKYPCQES